MKLRNVEKMGLNLMLSSLIITLFIGCTSDPIAAPTTTPDARGDNRSDTKETKDDVAQVDDSHRFNLRLPAAPSRLRVTFIGCTPDCLVNRCILSWQDNAENEDGFRIERKTSLNGDWQPLATVGANGRDFHDQQLVSNQLYFYRVIAFNRDGVSAPSNQVSIQVGDINGNLQNRR